MDEYCTTRFYTNDFEGWDDFDSHAYSDTTTGYYVQVTRCSDPIRYTASYLGDILLFVLGFALIYTVITRK